MNKLKSIVVILLLLAITAGIVFVPHIISDSGEKKRLNEKTYWNFSAQKTVKITDKQVAALYSKGEINVDVYANFDSLVSGKNEGQNNSEYEIKEDIGVLFDIVFKEDEAIRSCMKQMLSNSSIEYSQTRTLTMVEERPVVLSLVCAVAQTVHGTIEVTYEQKTHTPISLSYYSVYPLDESNTIKSEVLECVIIDYYKKQLSLSDKQFYVQYEFIDKDDFKNYYFLCGIVRYQKVIGEKEYENKGSYVAF